MIEFSIVVPVYNCEDHLRECLDSIVKQHDNNFELLLVNDGSTDSSLEICNEYREKFNFIKVYSKDNEGLLLTRRFSLKKANGEWIVWVDADDYLDESYFTTITEAIKTNQTVDMIIIKSKTISDDGKLLWEDKSYYKDGTIFEGEKGFYQLYFDLCDDFKINAMWKKITKKCVFDIETDYSPYKKVKGEDLLQSVPLLERASRILYVDKALYYYRLSKNGLGRNLKPKYVQDFQKVYGTLKDYIDQQYSDDTAIHRAFSNHYIAYIAALLKALPICISFSEYLTCINCLKKDQLIINRKNGIYKSNLDLKTSILITLEINCPGVFYRLAIIGKKLMLVIRPERN